VPTSLVLSHRRAVPLVLSGALLGSALRVGIGEAIPDWQFPVATFLVNLVGAFAVGTLWSRLRQRPEAFTLLVVGIGGAATTFSALTIEAVTLAEDGHTPVALLYVALSLVGGSMASLSGIRVGRRG
jgi:CrcB protein